MYVRGGPGAGATLDAGVEFRSPSCERECVNLTVYGRQSIDWVVSSPRARACF